MKRLLILSLIVCTLLCACPLGGRFLCTLYWTVCVVFCGCNEICFF